MPQSCNVCDQELREPTPEAHHLERSPIDPELCLGCWIGFLEIEKFLMRATDRMMWGLHIQTVMRKILELARDHSGWYGVFTSAPHHCNVCGQEVRNPTAESQHLERS